MNGRTRPGKVYMVNLSARVSDGFPDCLLYIDTYFSD
jgi:hypothetical protein